MTTTYFLLRTQRSILGNGAYLGYGPDGNFALVPASQSAHCFDNLEAAEQCAAQVGKDLGTFEIEIHNSAH